MSAVSARNAWAVGFQFTGTANRTLIEHWNGTAWKQVKSPNPGGAGGNSELLGVAAVSARSVWAVGTYSAGTVQHTLVVHWNGRSWKRVASRNPGGARGNELLGVAATSRRNVWAVGEFSTATAQHTLTEHWSGRSWRVVPSPNVTGASQVNLLNGVAATSATNAWAVGTSTKPSHATVTVILRWNGKVWKHVPSPRPRNAQNAELTGVSAISATDAWVVGSYRDQVKMMDLNLTERWNGKAWRIVASPSAPPPAHDGGLTAVTALSRTSVWAVGDDSSGPAEHVFIEHWNGKSWRRQL